jgi:CRP/FNR family transcriptional regulator
MNSNGGEAGESLLEFFRRRGTVQQYDKGEQIVHAEDDPFGVFYIDEGFVKVFSINSRGEEYIHVVYGPGEIFPIIWLVKHVRRQMFYDALAACRLLRVSQTELEAVLRSQAPMSYEMVERAAEQFGVFLDRINNLQYRYARERLIYYLLYLARRFGIVGEQGCEIILRVSHQVIASNVNLSRESVGREIDRLVRRGTVAIRNGHIVLRDVPALVDELPGMTAATTDWWTPRIPPRP